jgi:putative CocE/NonD family hydrolase
MKILFPVMTIVLLLHVLAVSGYSQIPSAKAIVSTTKDELSQPALKTRFVEKVKIPMRDKARLVADIVFPEGEGKYPTILIRTPYGRRVVTDWIKRGEFFAARGYAVVVQAVRGREDSEGEWQPWVNERKDGYDTIDWISRQSWSDGNVGMLGGSYLGEVQLLAAAEGHPALKCIVPYVSGSEHFFGVPYDYGVPNLEILDWLRVTTNKERTVAAKPLPNQELLKTLPLARLDDVYAGENFSIFDGWLKKDRPSDFAAAEFLADLSKPNKQIPILHLTGWWDGAANGVMRNYQTLLEAGHNRQWLVIGFWEHDFAQWDGIRTRYADVNYGLGSLFDFRAMYLRFFDTWLKGKRVGLDEMPKAQIFVTGANKWRSFDAFPANNSQEKTFYLDASPNGENNAGSLSEKTPNKSAHFSYTYDPVKVSVRRDVKFLNTTQLWFEPKDGDNLLFQSEPLNEAVEIGGDAELDFYFSTSAEDTDFFAHLVDVDERGEKRALTFPGKMRMRYLHDWEKPVALEPNKVYHAKIKLGNIAHQFEKGHRIGLAIRSEWFPLFARNLNTIEQIAGAARIVVAQQKIYADSQRPSMLRLKLLSSN